MVKDTKTGFLRELQYDLINQAVDYILSFNETKNITRDFGEIKAIENFKNQA